MEDLEKTLARLNAEPEKNIKELKKDSQVFDQIGKVKVYQCKKDEEFYHEGCVDYDNVLTQLKDIDEN